MSNLSSFIGKSALFDSSGNVVVQVNEDGSVTLANDLSLQGGLIEQNNMVSTQGSAFQFFSGVSISDPPTITLNGSDGSANFNGNVGIGTANPTYNLDITGTIRATSTAIFQGIQMWNSGELYYFSEQGGNEVFHIGNNSNAGMVINTSPGASTGDMGLSTVKNGNITLTPGGSGNVGIGESNPAYKLDVAGSGRFTGGVTIGLATVGTLPTASASTGEEFRVSDADSPVVGAGVNSGGSAGCKVISNGTDWIVTAIY